MRVHAESRYRAISGLSMGGGGALFYALHYPEMFVAAAPLSAVGGGMDIRSDEESIRFIEGVRRKKSGSSRANGYTNYLGEISERKS